MTFQGGSFEHWKHLNYMSFWYSLCGEMEVSSFALLLFGRIHCVSTCTVQFCFGNKEQVENVSFLSTLKLASKSRIHLNCCILKKMRQVALQCFLF
jgi:hypothetical protein